MPMDSSRDTDPPTDAQADGEPRRMKRSTLRSLLALTVLFDLALLGVLLYDYFQNDSDWMVYVLIAFAVFLIIALVLFLLTGRPEPAGERIVVKEVVREVEAPVEFEERVVERPVVVHEIRPIPPAPIRALRENPPRHIPAPARPVASGIPFVFNGYTLFHKVVQLKNEGGKRTIYFFSKRKPKSGSMCAKPLGYHVGVNERTGLPFLKKGTGPDGEDLTPTATAADEYRPQCSALTEDGKQCRNSARQGSKYCGPHFGYQPKTLKGSAKHIEGDDWSEDDDQTDSATVREADIKARVKGAKDTKPSIRKSFFGRRAAKS
jgi:hypothetical protein